MQGSLRGFALSDGCADFFGPEERMDAKAIVDWAGSEPWSTGKVGTFGGSYEGTTQLMAIGAGASVTASMLVSSASSAYGLQYDAGVGYAASQVLPANFALLQALYFNRTEDAVPVCAIDFSASALTIDDPDDPFWAARDAAPGVAGASVPILLTHGFNDGIVRPDHVLDIWPAFAGERTGVFSQYVHDFVPRADQVSQAVAFFAHHLEGGPAPDAPPVRVQDNEGRWRAEDLWPPADSQPFELELRTGSVGASATSAYASVDHSATISTFTEPQSADAHLSGAGLLEVDASFAEGGPPPQIVAGMYDVAPDGSALLLSRGATLLRAAGSATADLHAQDWRLRAGHRLGVALSVSESAVYNPARTAVTVTIGEAAVTIPVLSWTRDRYTDGGLPHGSTLPASTAFDAALIAANGVAVALPATSPHACTSSPSRSTCPLALRGSPADDGVVTSVLDDTLFYSQGFGYELVVELPEVDDPRDLTFRFTPEAPILVDANLYVNTGAEDPEAPPLNTVVATDPWSNGLVWPHVDLDRYVLWAPHNGRTQTGAGQSANVRIEGILRSGAPRPNDPPTAVDDRAFTPEGTPVTIEVLANDVDPDDDPLALDSWSGAANGTVDCMPEGSCTYTPNPGFEGTDEFTYVVCDDREACDEGAVAVEVGGDVVVQCSTIDDADPSISYKGGWHRRKDERASNGGYHRRMGSHNTENGNGSTPTLRVRFEGDALTYDYVRSDRGGVARIYVDGELVEELSYGANQPGPENPTFGHLRTYSGFGSGAHELVIEHLHGAVYVDGFSVPCEAGSAMASEPGEFGSETQTSTHEGTRIELPVSTDETAREISVAVDGCTLPAVVEILDPLGSVLATGESLMGGATSGTDAVVASPGTHTVRVTLPGALVEPVEISVAVTVERPSRASARESGR